MLGENSRGGNLNIGSRGKAWSTKAFTQKSYFPHKQCILPPLYNYKSFNLRKVYLLSCLTLSFILFLSVLYRLYFSFYLYYFPDSSRVSFTPFQPVRNIVYQIAIHPKHEVRDSLVDPTSKPHIGRLEIVAQNNKLAHLVGHRQC